MDLFLGIDLGTTAVKAAVMSAKGHCAARFSQTYPTLRPAPGHAEQNPDDWMRLITAALQSFADASLPAIGFGSLTSQVNTHVFVDAKGQPLAPAILWQDTRAASEAAELDALLTPAEKTALLGAPIPIDASHPLARMLWMQRHRPNLWEKTAHVLLPKDYCLFHLTGNLATDPLANVGLVGPGLHYVPEILALLPGARDRMAPLAQISEVIGHITSSHPLAGIQMACGTLDAWAGLFGAGASREGAAVWLSGTSEVLGLCATHTAGTPGIVVFPSISGVKLHAGPTQSGGASQLWLCNLLGLTVETLVTQLQANPRRQGTPLFLPHLAGERAPLWDATLRGAFLGLDAATSRTDLARATLEGVALSGRHVLESLQTSAAITPETLTCGGGGFASNPWGQIRADVINRPLKRLTVNEPAVLGATALACVAAGATLPDAQSSLAQYDHTWTPNPANRALYDDLFGLYLEAITANASIGRRLQHL